MSLHAATFRILGFEPQPSAAAEAAIQQLEKRLGICLPRSVRDWYGRADAVTILAGHSNADPLIPLEDLALHDSESRQLLPFRNENQGVCTWAIDLTGSDDPPVYVDVDSGGTEWQLLASSFSQYVYSCVWDYRLVFGQPALVQAQIGALSASALATLSNLFGEEVRTHGWPGDTQYRFHREGQAILIWNAPKRADWFIAGSTADSLRRALVAVWNLDDVGKSLYDCSAIGREVLENIRGQA